MNDRKLKRCPFCGKEGVLVKLNENPLWYGVMCIGNVVSPNGSKVPCYACNKGETLEEAIVA